MAFDRTKPYGARSGRKAEIAATLKDGRLIVVYDDGASYFCLPPNGRLCNGIDSPFDLVNIPEKRVVVINHYTDGCDRYHESLEAADKNAAPNRFDCTVLEYERPVFDGE